MQDIRSGRRPANAKPQAGKISCYQLQQEKLSSAGHLLVAHELLTKELTRVIREEDKAERLRAVQALRYAKKRKEGLVKWSFDISKIERKNVIAWAEKKVQDYFIRLS